MGSSLWNRSYTFCIYKGMSFVERLKVMYLSFVERLVLFQSVLYRRYHCINYKLRSYRDHCLGGVDETELCTGVVWVGHATPDCLHQG